MQDPVTHEPTNHEPATANGRSSLGHIPDARWEFDQSVTAVFDDMLARSIPQIAGMRDAVTQVASRFVQPGTHVVDLGCALGEAIGPLVARFSSTNRFVGIEVSVPMLQACRERFRDTIDAGVVDIRDDDLRTSYPDVDASVTLAVLTLMFTPLEHRFRVLADVFNHTRPGGAFVLVEKILGSDARMDALLLELYFQHKRTMGYSSEEIDRKRLALEGVLVPLTAEWNERLLRSAGFAHTECFWRCLNFCGWVAIKT
jgi:tRNA (cmo5U34)-methyltransferase